MKNTLAFWSYGIGIMLVVLTHIYMLIAGMPANMMAAHAMINLFASALLAFGWFKR